MIPAQRLSENQLEDQMHCLIGRFFVTFARLELNLSLQVGGKGSFEHKILRFLRANGGRVSDKNLEFGLVSAWYMAADSVRDTRNLFAHGRWSVLAAEQVIVHVSQYPDTTQTERFYSLVELDALIKEVERLEADLWDIVCPHRRKPRAPD